MNVWKVQLSFFSLAKGEVCKPLPKKPIQREYDSPVLALLDLEKSIEQGEADEQGVSFCRKMIITPDGRELPFDSFYTEVFGVAPVKQDNRENLYPALRKAQKKY